MTLQLIIGNRNYSSWSLRAWWYMRASGLSFTTTRIPLFTGSWKQEIARYSEAGRVPVLLDGDLAVWDTMAIFAHLQERFPESALGWPAEQPARSRARSLAAEMHSGFMAIRDELPQNLRARNPRELSSYSASGQREIARMHAMWTHCYEQHDGPWLFGDRGIVDAMYAPVALRFVTYGIVTPEPAAAFVRAVTDDPHIAEWVAEARAEEESLPFIDNLQPASDSPLTLG